MSPKIVISLFGFFLIIMVPGYSQAIVFNDYFQDGTLRIDYFHVGHATEEFITLDQLYRYPRWAGNPGQLLEQSKVGMYYIKVYDVHNKKLIFSKGFNSYFGEYQTSNPAINGTRRTFHESALIPLPKNNILFTIEKRDRKNRFKQIFSLKIQMDDVTIQTAVKDPTVQIIDVSRKGPAAKKVDIVVLAEGYLKKDKNKVLKDLAQFKKLFFSLEPYKSRQDDFNLIGLFKPSVDQGCDEPTHGIFKNTAVGTTFYSMRSSRYLLTEANKDLRDIAGHVPYDSIFIMVNHSRYGGGGIYNFYCTFTADNIWNGYLILHEFGHSFTGLADEYYSSSTAYNEFYPKGIEPVEPNITALLDPKQVKWQDQLTKGIAVPTPWNKEKYDNRDTMYQVERQRLNRKIASLKQKNQNIELLKQLQQKANKLSVDAAKRTDKYLKNSKYAGKVGVFEGAGYASKGLYRPMLDCLMFSKGMKPYCRVCYRAVMKTIDFYTK